MSIAIAARSHITIAIGVSRVVVNSSLLTAERNLFYAFAGFFTILSVSHSHSKRGFINTL